MVRRSLVVVLTALVMTVPPAASAATKTVDAGPLGPYRAAFWRVGTDVNVYVPGQVTIRLGDRVRFRPRGVHTVHLLARHDGRSLRSLTAVSDPVTDLRDAAGRPFWFNGQRRHETTRRLLRHRFGTRSTFTGRRDLLSGFLGGGPPRPWTVTFRKAGTVRFVCDYHPGMRGTIRVLPRSRRAPSAAGELRAARRLLDRRLRTARTLKAATPGPGIVNVGNADGGGGGLEFYDFVPKQTTVPVGGTLLFRASPGSRETHSVATGPGLPDTQPSSYLGLIARTFQQVGKDPRAVYPSEPPGVVASLTPGLHGNGFWSSGVLDRTAATPFPPGRSLRFTEPGTYVFSCLIHTYMHTTVYVG